MMSTLLHPRKVPGLSIGPSVGYMPRNFAVGVISAFRLGLNWIVLLLGCYAAWMGSQLLACLQKLSVPASGVKMGSIGCPETSVTNYQSTLPTNQEELGTDLCDIFGLSKQMPR